MPYIIFRVYTLRQDKRMKPKEIKYKRTFRTNQELIQWKKDNRIPPSDILKEHHV